MLPAFLGLGPTELILLAFPCVGVVAAAIVLPIVLMKSSKKPHDAATRLEEDNRRLRLELENEKLREEIERRRKDVN